MQEKDRKYLHGMLEAAQDALHFARNRTRDDLERDRQLTLSLVKCLEWIGQAASKVSKECRLDCKPIPWEEVMDLKQQVVHTYWEVDLDWVWKTVSDDVPQLVDALEILLKQ